MRYIRINNDVKIKWEILRNTDPEVFTGKDITVKLFSKCGCAQPITYNIVDNFVFIDFFGKDQHETGAYRLCLIENDGKPNMSTLDYVDCFILSKTLKNQTSSGLDSSSTLETEVVELSSKINTTGVEYIGGDGIDVIGSVISVDDTIAKKSEVDEKLETKVDKTELANYATKSNVDGLIEHYNEHGRKQEQLNNEFSSAITMLSNIKANKSDLDNKQDKLTAGDNIKIEDNKISVFDVVKSKDYGDYFVIPLTTNHKQVFFGVDWGDGNASAGDLSMLGGVTYLGNEKLKDILNKKANIEDIPGIPDLSEYATKVELSNYVTNGVFNTYQINNNAELSSINSNIEAANLQIWLLSNNKADKSQLDNYATKSELNTKANITDLSDYTRGSDFKTINGESILGEGDVTITVPTKVSELENDSKFATTTTLKNYQKLLMSGTNIKTINGESILGSGDIVIQGGSGEGGSYDDTEIRGIIEQAKADIEKYDSTKADYTWDANDFGAFDGGYHKTHGSGASGTDPLTQNLPSECYTDQAWNSCSGILYSILENTIDLHGYQFYFCCSGTYEGNIYVRFNANVKQPWGYWGTWKQLGGESGGSSAGDVYATMDNIFSANNIFNGAVTVNYDYTNVMYAGQPWSLAELTNGKYISESLNTQANYIGYRYNANMQKITSGVFNYVEQEGYIVFEFEKPFEANYVGIGFNGEYIEPYNFQSGKLNEADGTYTGVINKDKTGNLRLFVTYRTEDVPVIDGSYVIPEVILSYKNAAYYDPIIQKRIQWGNGINAIDYGSYVSVEANATGGGSTVTSVNGATGDVTINVPTNISELNNDSGYATYGDLSNYVTKTELENTVSPQTPNLIKYGNLPVNNGQIYGFSTANYAKFPFLVDLRDKSSFVIMMNITTGDDVITQQNILDGDKGLALAIRDGQWVLAVSTDGVNWVGEMVGGSIQPNTNYPFVELKWNNGRYTLKYHNGQYFTTAIDYSTIGAPYPCNILIGKDVANNYPFRGSIDLNGCYLEIDNSRVWNGMGDVGLATRLDTSLSNIDANGENKIKEIVGDNFATKDEIPSLEGYAKTTDIPDTSNFATKDEIPTVPTNTIIFTATLEDGTTVNYEIYGEQI